MENNITQYDRYWSIKRRKLEIGHRCMFVHSNGSRCCEVAVRVKLCRKHFAQHSPRATISKGATQ